MSSDGYVNVLTPPQIAALTAAILAAAERLPAPAQELAEFRRRLLDFGRRWEGAFLRFGQTPAGELTYQDLLLSFQEQIAAQAAQWRLPAEDAGWQALETIRAMLWPPPVPKRISRRLLAQQKRASDASAEPFCRPTFDRPIFIVSAPRAGSTLLFETLLEFPDVWTIGEESHETIEGIPDLHPAARSYRSNGLAAADATPQIAATLRARFTHKLQDRTGRRYLDLAAADRPAQVRFVEKTPKNALRIRFLNEVFPGALFLYLYREPRENISSLLEGWRSRRFVAYRGMPGWPFREWSFLLVPGWEALQHCSLAEIAAYQWKSANAAIIEDLQTLPASSWRLIRYADLIQAPQRIITAISEFGGLRRDARIEQRLVQPLPVSRFTLSAPAPEKWRKYETEIAAVFPTVEPIITLIDRMTQTANSLS